MIRLTLAILLTFASVCQAGVYDTLEFGDNRATVTKKLKASSMVEQQMEGAFFGRTGLNGVFKCKAKLAGLTYHLYFNWSESGGLEEITLRSQELPMDNYSTALQEAWSEANKLFTKVYNYPVQDANYPKKSDFKGHDMLITHLWHKGASQSILIGPGINKEKCFLAIRFVNKRIQPVKTP